MTRILFACFIYMTIVMSAMTMSTEDEFALQAAFPCRTLESTTINSDLSSVSSPDEGEPTTLMKLGQVIHNTQNILSTLTSNTPWRCSPTNMNKIRPNVHFHWTWNNDNGMTEQEKERLQTLIRLTGYAVFLKTATTSTSALTIYNASGLLLLRGLHDEIQKANCQVRNLLLNFSDRTIYSKTRNSIMPNGLGYLQSAIESNTSNQGQRLLTCLAIEDMHDTFSHLVVTSTRISLGSK